jgi:hypothetical protein
MAKGKAAGANLEYQRTCRDVWVQRSGGKLRPYRDTDGLDVSFEAGGTTWTFDIVLEDDEGGLHVGEAKRWEKSVDQGEVRKFAAIMDDLRATGIEVVEGVLFAKTDAQAGALDVAGYRAIRLIISGENQPLPEFSLAIVRSAPNRRGRVTCFEVGKAERVQPTDTVEATVVHAHGSKE